MVQCDKTNRRKTLDEFALEAEGNEEDDPDLFKAPGVPWFTGTAIIINFFLMAQYKWFPDHVAFAALYGLAYIGYFFSKKKSGGHADGSTNPSGHSLHPSGMSLKA